MMPAELPAAAFLEALGEPALIVDAQARVRLANSAARRRLGLAAGSADLAMLCPGPEAAIALRTYLRRCSGSRTPLPGGCELAVAKGEVLRFRCQAGLLSPGRDGLPAVLLLRLTEAGDERFSVLARKIEELNAEVRERRAAQAGLEAALGERDLLLRELHHRVKNNIQMLAAMLSLARREAGRQSAAPVLDEAARRLGAVAAAHQILYDEGSLHGVGGGALVARLGALSMQAAGAASRLVVEADTVEIANDAVVPAALALNELLTNAVKHGIAGDDRSKVVVRLHCLPEGVVELAVEDGGAGFTPDWRAASPTSGLSLVRGLARQLGGTFAVEQAAKGGARCVLRFPDVARTGLRELRHA